MMVIGLTAVLALLLIPIFKVSSPFSKLTAFCAVFMIIFNLSILPKHWQCFLITVKEDLKKKTFLCNIILKCSSRTDHLIWWAPQTPKLYIVQKIPCGAKKWKVKYFQEDSLSCRLQANNFSVVTTNRQCARPCSSIVSLHLHLPKKLSGSTRLWYQIFSTVARWEVLIEVKWYPGHCAVVFHRNDFTLA